jgi:hypothetical protein
MSNRPIFNGTAIAVRGQIDWPTKLTIPVHGASCLAVNGGVSECKIGAKRFGKHLSFKSAFTRVSGSVNRSGDEMTTTATSQVTGVKIAQRLTVDTVEGTLRSSHAAEVAETAVVPLRARIVNLRLDGIPVRVALDTKPFHEFDTKSKIENAERAESSFVHRYGRHLMSPKGGAMRGPTLEASGGMLFGTVVRDLSTKHKDVEIEGNMIYLPDYGRIYLGEILIAAGRRRLTMLRVQLGSPVGGEAVCADIESNGSIIF